jgi:general secretion pathway protein J
MGERGFTLVELLLAITLMSMLLALAYGGLRAATRASESGQAILQESGQIRSAHQFIRRQLNQMQPLPFGVQDDLDETSIVFEGSSRHIQFVAPMPGYLGNGGPQVQLLEIVPGAEGDELLFSHALLRGFDPANLSVRDPILLLGGIETAAFEFLGMDEEGELTGWTGTWDDPGNLPVAVRLGLEFGEHSQALWPSLSTGVRVDPIAVNSSAAARTYKNAIQEMINPTGEPET